jgi:hypothetical protein
VSEPGKLCNCRFAKARLIFSPAEVYGWMKVIALWCLPLEALDDFATPPTLAPNIDFAASTVEATEGLLASCSVKHAQTIDATHFKWMQAFIYSCLGLPRACKCPASSSGRYEDIWLFIVPSCHNRLFAEPQKPHSGQSGCLYSLQRNVCACLCVCI